MNLREKNIILISSEAWGDLFISKHNYAVALAKRGNFVYFLNPIDVSLPFGRIKIEASDDYPNLKIVTYRPFFPLFLKFHFRAIFEILIKWNVKILVRKLNIRPDIVWDFNCSYLYKDLTIFKAPIKIFNPVDHLADDAIDKKADLIISISDRILNQCAASTVPKLKLNHGLADSFIDTASNSNFKITGSIVHAAYIGNLNNGSLDWNVITKTVLRNSNVIFHFIGPDSYVMNNLGANAGNITGETAISGLKNMPNVFFHGKKTQKEISKILLEYDVFILCYKTTAVFKGDNSHKIMEYLASGKVIVSTYLSSYKGSKLIEMSGENKNDEYPELFHKVISNIQLYNDSELQKRRRDFALENTYENHISRIEEFTNGIDI